MWGIPSGTGMCPELVERPCVARLCALSLSKGTHLFDSLLPALAVWRRPRWGSRLAAGHPQGLALTTARTAPHCQSREQGVDEVPFETFRAHPLAARDAPHMGLDQEVEYRNRPSSSARLISSAS